MKKRTYGAGSVCQIPSGNWLLQYKPKWASKRQSKTVEAASEKAAQRLLSDWVTELDGLDGPSVEVSIDDLIGLHITDMRLKGRDPVNIDHVERRAKKHLAKYFANVDFAKPLKKAAIKKYEQTRISAGAARATVNREVAALRRAMQLGIDDELIRVPLPKIDKLEENNIRTGVIEEDVYYAIMQCLPEHQQMLWCFAYYLGIRKGELLKIRLSWLLPYWKLEEPFIKVPGFDKDGNRITKSGKPHTVPLYHSAMRAFVEMALAKRDPTCPWLFQYRGKQPRHVRTGFEKACVNAGHPDVIFHDTRRTAISRMEDAGIPRREAMQISGHLTESVYKRYDIGTQRGATETGRKLREFDAQRSKFANEFANGPTEGDPSGTGSSTRKHLN